MICSNLIGGDADNFTASPARARLRGCDFQQMPIGTTIYYENYATTSSECGTSPCLQICTDSTDHLRNNNNHPGPENLKLQ